MTKCPECGKKIEKRTIREFRDDVLLGLSGVVLVDSVVRYRCPACGFEATSIPRQGELGTAMAVARAKHPQKLAGRDVRFLRKEMGLTAKALAAKIGVHVETISRWENDREPIGPSSEKLLRLMVLIELGDKALGVDYDERAVAAMRVEAVRRTRGFEARLQLAPMRVERKRQTVWSELLPQAA
jgi:putative zinc finger/helix-turn-helix YgiT family protein